MAWVRLSTRTFTEDRLEIDRFCIQISCSPVLLLSLILLWPLPDDSTNVERQDRALGYAKYLVTKLRYYQSLIAVFGYVLAVTDATARLARTHQHRQDTELTCDDRSVCQDPAYVGH